jgi:hypothetical protein
VGFDHSLQHVTDGGDLAIAHIATGSVCSGHPICYSEDSTQIVRRVTPFRSQPAVVVVQPSDHRTNIESAVNRIQCKRSTGHPSAVGNICTGHHGPKDSTALREAQRLQAAADGVEQDVARSVEGKLRVDLVVVYVRGNVKDFGVVLLNRSFGRVGRGHLCRGRECGGQRGRSLAGLQAVGRGPEGRAGCLCSNRESTSGQSAHGESFEGGRRQHGLVEPRERSCRRGVRSWEGGGVRDVRAGGTTNAAAWFRVTFCRASSRCLLLLVSPILLQARLQWHTAKEQ